MTSATSRRVCCLYCIGNRVLHTQSINTSVTLSRLQDAAIRGWFRTQRNPLTGAPHLRVIGLTALEIAAAMQHLHDQKVLHGVSGRCPGGRKEEDGIFRALPGKLFDAWGLQQLSWW